MQSFLVIDVHSKRINNNNKNSHTNQSLLFIYVHHLYVIFLLCVNDFIARNYSQAIVV